MWPFLYSSSRIVSDAALSLGLYRDRCVEQLKFHDLSNVVVNKFLIANSHRHPWYYVCYFVNLPRWHPSVSFLFKHQVLLFHLTQPYLHNSFHLHFNSFPIASDWFQYNIADCFSCYHMFVQPLPTYNSLFFQHPILNLQFFTLIFFPFCR